MQDEFLVAAAVAYVRYSSFEQSGISIEATKRREEKKREWLLDWSI